MQSIWMATHTITVPNPGPLDDTHHDVVVVGAGITGLTTAALLARAGKKVLVLEARQVGALATGNTTAKLSLLQGTVLSDIAAHAGDDLLRAHVEAQREGQAWLVRFMDDRDVRYQRRDAFTYATTKKGDKALRAEADACATAGLPVTWTAPAELPFAATALTLPDQVQLHPLLVLDALLADLRSHSGTVAEGVRVTGADVGHGSVRLTTSGGPLTADRVVLATGTPILDRGLHAARLVPSRSYATTHRVPGAIPQGMYLSADDPKRSLRTVPVGDEELLMVGGNGHVVGRSDSEADAVADLGAARPDADPRRRPRHRRAEHPDRGRARQGLGGGRAARRPRRAPRRG